MNKFFKELYYRYKLSEYSFIYSENLNYTILLEDCLKYDIENIKLYNNGDTLRVTFKNNTVYGFVNTNIFYGWLCSCYFHLGNGTIFKFSKARPSVEVMYKFKTKLENYTKTYTISQIVKNNKTLKGN